jgi:transposase
VYWIPVYESLESRGFEVYLVNARQVKNVSGRKTDMLGWRFLPTHESEAWTGQSHDSHRTQTRAHGLLFVEEPDSLCRFGQGSFRRNVYSTGKPILDAGMRL